MFLLSRVCSCLNKSLLSIMLLKSLSCCLNRYIALNLFIYLSIYLFIYLLNTLFIIISSYSKNRCIYYAENVSI